MTETKTSVKGVTDGKLQEIQELANDKKQTNIMPVELKQEEIQEIEQTFENVSDFGWENYCSYW